MRSRVATVVVIIALLALAAYVGNLKARGMSEFGDLGWFRGQVRLCHTADRCPTLHPRPGQRVAVIVRRMSPKSTAAIRGTFGVAREGTFSGGLSPGTYRVTLRPSTLDRLPSDTMVVTLRAQTVTPITIAYGP